MGRDTISINLDEKHRKMINFIKKEYGLKHDTDAVRLALNDGYRMAKERSKIFTRIHEN